MSNEFNGIKSAKMEIKDKDEIERHFSYIHHHPFSCYKSYMELIRIFKARGDSKGLYHLRLQFPHDIFLLPLQEWIEWLSELQKHEQEGNGESNNFTNLLNQALKDYPYSQEIYNFKNMKMPSIENQKVMEYENQIMNNEKDSISLEFWLNYLQEIVTFDSLNLKSNLEISEKQEKIEKIQNFLNRALRLSPKILELWQLYFEAMRESNILIQKDLIDRAKKSVSNPTKLTNSLILTLFNGDNQREIEDLIGETLLANQKKELFQLVPNVKNFDQWIQLLDLNNETECRNFAIIAKSLGFPEYSRMIYEKCPILGRDWIEFEQSCLGNSINLLQSLLSSIKTCSKDSSFSSLNPHQMDGNVNVNFHQGERLNISKRKRREESNNPRSNSSNSSPFIELPFDREKTVFVSNLDFKLKQAELEEFFKKLNIGTVKRIDFINSEIKRDHGQGHRLKFKGYAHVEFSNKISRDQALTLDRSKLNGRPVFISPFNPQNKDKERDKLISYSEERNEKTLYVSNLSKELSKQDLEEIFGKYSGIKEIRLVTTKDGTSRGFAYIEFTDLNSAMIAMNQENDQIYLEQSIKVAISDQSSIQLLSRRSLLSHSVSKPL